MSIQIKKQQQIIVGGIVLGLGFIFGLLVYWGQKTESVKAEDKSSLVKHTLASAISREASEAHWIEKTQNAWRIEQEKGKERDKKVKNLDVMKDKQKDQIEAQKEEIVTLKSMLNDLVHQVTDLQTRTSPISNEMLDNELSKTDEMQINALETGFIQYTASLSNIKKPRIKTPDNYVFSNTFAKAKVLQGADASAGVLSQSNPDVMILQILDDGIMPNNHRSPLKNCFVSVSVVGDISSERGKVRTERLSCIHPDGTSLDTQVTGIVSDSKNGIRGKVVWRDQPMLKKAFWGSFWESMGNVGQQYAHDVSTSPLGSVATIQPEKIPLAAASSGASGASKMYASYNIKRAEMYHPVIQLAPGMIVDVVFLKGFWLDGGSEEKAPEKPSQNSEYKSAEAQEAQQFFNNKHDF
jgi:conjugal transfer pilus assembly protein TraB